MKARSYKKKMPVRLSDSEIAKRAQEIAEHALEACDVETLIDKAKERARETIKGLKDDLAVLRVRLRNLSLQVRAGEEIRPVAVEARVALDNSKVEIVRLDTGEIVEQRPLTDEDRQMELDEVLARIEADSVRSAEPAEAPMDHDDEPDVFDESSGDAA